MAAPMAIQRSLAIELLIGAAAPVLTTPQPAVAASISCHARVTPLFQMTSAAG